MNEIGTAIDVSTDRSTRMVHSRARWLVALPLALVLVAAACGSDSKDSGDGGGSGSGSTLSGSITADGSSTVGPLTTVAAELFQQENSGVQITVGTSGTGGGFKKFCAGETDMNDASRPIKDDDPAEGPACKANGIEYAELQVANDGISIVVNNDNDWAECLTVDQLKTMWEPAAEGKVTNWNQVDPSFPDEELTLFGAGTSSGTFDFFTDAITGEEGASRTDYNATEDDNVTVQGVEGSKGAIGYFGLSYYEENQGKLKVVKVDGGSGCVEPTTATVQDGTYTPLSRPLFVYPSGELMSSDYGKAFVEYYIDNAEQIAKEALFVPLTSEQLAESKDEVAAFESSDGTSSST